MDWIANHQWEAWLILALALVALEMLTLDFTMIMVALGAVAATVAALLGGPIWLQIIIALIVTSASLVFIRPEMARRMHRGPTIKTTPESLAGESGLVLERVTAYDGRVKLHGEVWSARTTTPEATVEPGSHVVVESIDGATAMVRPTDQPGR